MLLSLTTERSLFSGTGRKWKEGLGRQDAGDRGEGGADHPPADVGREALPRAAQVNRVNPRKVVAPETELGHRKQPRQEDAYVKQAEKFGFRADPRQLAEF